MTSRPRVARFRIRVTEAHIEKALQSNKGHCAIAEALREVPGISHPKVDTNYLSFSHGPTGLRYTLPMTGAARAFIQHFDRDRQRVGPTTLEFEFSNAVLVNPRRTGQKALPGVRKIGEPKQSTVRR